MDVNPVLLGAAVSLLSALSVLVFTRRHQLDQDEKRDKRNLRDNRRERLRTCYQAVLHEVWRLRDAAELRVIGQQYPPLGMPGTEEEARVAASLFRTARVQLALENEMQVRDHLNNFGLALQRLFDLPPIPGALETMKTLAQHLEEAMQTSLEELQQPIK